MLERLFKLSEHNTDVKTEFMAGLATFLAMVYILLVNSELYSNPLGNGVNVLGVPYGAIYVATAITAIIGCILMAFMANLPFAMACGMGINAFFIYTICVGLGFTYANALVLILIDGLVFILLTVTGIRSKIFAAVPKTVRGSISAGIGLFIIFLGLQKAGIVVNNSNTCVDLGSFNILAPNSWAVIMPMFVSFVTLITICLLARKKNRAAILCGMMVGAATYFVLGFLTVPHFTEALSIASVSPVSAFKQFMDFSFYKVFADGFNFSHLCGSHTTGEIWFLVLSTSFAFLLIDMFDTLGTLYGTCYRNNMIREDGTIENFEKAMMSDAVATAFGAVCGVSTVTTYAESTTGIAAGGRTGLTSVFTALFFLVALFFTPLAAVVPGCVVAAALVYVGILMSMDLKSLMGRPIEDVLPCLMTMVIIPFTCNIAYGIAFGIISHVVMYALCGRVKEVKVSSWVIMILFVTMLLIAR